MIFSKVHIIDDTLDTLANLVIENGLIQRVDILDGTPDPSLPVYLPAFTDLHAHFRDPGLTYKEDVESGSRAAVRGGYTAVNLMPNTLPVVSSVAQARDVEDRITKLDLIQANQAHHLLHRTFEHGLDPEGHVGLRLHLQSALRTHAFNPEMHIGRYALVGVQMIDDILVRNRIGQTHIAGNHVLDGEGTPLLVGVPVGDVRDGGSLRGLDQMAEEIVGLRRTGGNGLRVACQLHRFYLKKVVQRYAFFCTFAE